MAQQALPERTARLGRAMGAGGPGTAPNAVVLLLPGHGTARSVRRDSALAAAAMLPLARKLVRTAREEPPGPGGRRAQTPGDGEGALVAHVVRYRYRGWNGESAHPAADAAWAVTEVVRRYGDVPVSLVGVDMGARAALRAAGHPAVASVLALSPWLPQPEGPRQEGGPGGEGAAGTGGESEADAEPVRQLAGRHVLFVHGSDDEHTPPELSYRLAGRAKKTNADVCRFEVHTDGHSLRQHRVEVGALAADFVLGTVCGRRFARPLVDAFAAPPPLGLRMPLAKGFGQGSGHRH